MSDHRARKITGTNMTGTFSPKWTESMMVFVFCFSMPGQLVESGDDHAAHRQQVQHPGVRRA
jgi:hypothetical protein